ncbi:hypothetical protein [Cumulibacter soli]|uniref:hypothetical protein n=1 Tax=Cumulibacter soli TaxID=2546344 RepID=UPI00106736E1|nr:hypothetical protein [Cumulibacter soli]
MSDLSTPDELFARLAEHEQQVERRAKKDHHFDKYAVLGMHADVRPYLDNWSAYNQEQHVAIAEAINYLTQAHDMFADAGRDGYDDDRDIVAALPETVRRLGNE